MWEHEEINQLLTQWQINIKTQSMAKTTKQTLLKIAQILRKPQNEREYQELHFLTLNFKKNVVSISNVNDWWLLTRCIQSLELHDWTTISKEDIDWIFVLEGQLVVHGIVYSEGEQFSMLPNDHLGLELCEDSLYSILTTSNKQKAISEAEERTVAQKKLFVRKILFEESVILNKDLNHFWEESQQYRVKKGQHFDIGSMDDRIFVVVQGSIDISYQWKRLIKLRELGPGSIFSTFLGRYFYKTSQELKAMEKYQFQVVSRTECLILSFSPDIFYQMERFKPYKFIVDKAWKYYQQRVAEIKRIINGIGLLRPEKEEVVKNMKEEIEVKFLREKGISVPVAIERRKFRKIISSIFQQRSSRRKVPNKATTQSARTLQTTNQFSQVQPKTPQRMRTIEPTTQVREPKGFDFGERSKTLKIKRVNTLPIHDRESHQRTFSIRSKTERGNTVESNRHNESNKTDKEKSQGSFYRFFRPEEFISKKLKTHYQSILVNMSQIKLPLDQSLSSSNIAKLKTSKSKKQYFEEYVNERRIVKLGPKKRLLYKKRPGF